MRDIQPHPLPARTPLRDVRTPDGAAVRASVAAARELSAAVGRLLPATSGA